MVYADAVNILEGSVHTVKGNAEALVVVIKEIGLEVNSEKLSAWSCFKIRMKDTVTV
jgi:hypothetical protein